MYLHYLDAPRNQKKYTQIWRFGAIIWSLNCIKFVKPYNKHLLFLIFFSILTVFQSLFNFNSILAYQTSKFEFSKYSPIFRIYFSPNGHCDFVSNFCCSVHNFSTRHFLINGQSCTYFRLNAKPEIQKLNGLLT